MKKIFISLMILAFGVTFAMAADETTNGTVVAIDGNMATIEVSGNMAWVKKGAYVRAVTESGKLMLRSAKITAIEGNVITVQTSMTKEMKAGDKYKMSKGKPSAGC
jgi:hypothetical protein